MKIENLIRNIKLASEKADKNIYAEFDKFLTVVENDLRSKAPVDSGAFKDAWKATGIHGSSSLTATVSNNTAYAGAIEFGSSPGGKPWPSPGPKTALSGGRIYSKQAIGGTIDKVFDEKRINDFAFAIARSIVRAFK